jgi:hypothetical protein
VGLVVVATMWTGARIIQPVRGALPNADELAELAAKLAPENAGVPPDVRVVGQLPPLVPVVRPSGELPEETQEQASRWAPPWMRTNERVR